MSLHPDKFIQSWNPHVSDENIGQYVELIENGHIIYFPNLIFSINQNELALLTPKALKAGKKNISFNAQTNQTKGYDKSTINVDELSQMMKRFYSYAHTLVSSLFPQYISQLQVGRTSFRPAEITDRATSYRKDDRRLHIDAFPATPVHGLRMLRVFTNINFEEKPRVWRVGEPFAEVIKKFIPNISAPLPFAHDFLSLIKMTKKKRSLYDHYMLRLHDAMKRDMMYQEQVAQETIAFAANTTWIVFTDQVSHAAMSGQHMLEQTFYLPPQAQQFVNLSPLKQLENYLNKSLI